MQTMKCISKTRMTDCLLVTYTRPAFGERLDAVVWVNIRVSLQVDSSLAFAAYDKDHNGGHDGEPSNGADDRSYDGAT